MARCKNGHELSIWEKDLLNPNKCDQCARQLAKESDVRQREAMEQLLEDKARKIEHLIAKRVQLGKVAFVYCSVHLPVNSVVLQDPLNVGFSVEPLVSLGLKGWDVVGIVPKTVGVGLKNTSLGQSSGITWGAGIGGNVSGVHVILRKTVASMADLDDDDVTLVAASSIATFGN
jgi:hypothetical protein